MRKPIRIMMSLLVSICMFIMLIPVVVFATVPTVWVEDSAHKVWDNATMPTGAATSISLYAARNEYEAAQICVYNPNGSTLAVSSFTVNSLSKAGGGTIASSNISVRREYIHPDISEASGGYQDSKPAGASGWPDALIGTGETIGTFNAQNIAASKTGVYWYSVYVPDGTAAGVYTGTVVVNTDQGNVTVNVSVKVYDTTVPSCTDASSYDCYDWSTMPYDGGQYAGYVLAGLDFPPNDDPNYMTFAANLAANMKKHRLNVVDVSMLMCVYDDLQITDNGNADTYTFDWTDFDDYIQKFVDAGCCKYIVFTQWGSKLDDSIGVFLRYIENGQQVEALLSYTDSRAQNYINQMFQSLYDHCVAKGWASKMMLYGIDEPGTTGQCEGINWIAGRFHYYFGASQKVLCAYWDDNVYDDLSGLDIHVPMQEDYWNLHRDFYKQLAADGKSFWLYYLNNPQGPYLNQYISMNLDRPRLFPWYVWHEGGTGQLFYALHGYNYALTETEAFNNNHNGNWNFTYPDVSEFSFYDSIRYEAQLDGLEDAELMKILAQSKPVTAGKIYDSLFGNPADLTDYTWSGANVTQAHRNILGAITSTNPDGYDPRAAWGFNSSGSDSSGNGYTLTLYNSPTYDTSSFTEGSASLSLNGTTTYAGTSDVVTDATDNVTLSAWVKCNSTTGDPLIIYNGNPGTNGYGIMCYSSNYYGAGKLSILCGGLTYLDADATLPTDGSWAHVAAVRNDGVWTLYLNGTPYTVRSNTTTPKIPSSAGTVVGVLFNGKIDDARIYNRPISLNEVRQLAKCELNDDYKAAWYLNSNGNDASGNGNNMTAYGSPTYSTADKKEGTASVSLNGSSQYFRRTSPVTTATDNITMSAWVNWSGTISSQQIIVFNGTDAVNGYGIYIDHYNSDHLSICVGGVRALVSNYSLPAGVWTHVAAVRRSGMWELYINGVNVLPAGNTDAPITPASNTIIGADYNGSGSFYFNGKIDEVKIFERALSQEAILQECIMSDDYKAAWYLNSSASDSGGNGYDMTAYGSPTYNTGYKKEGTASISLNGSSQYLKRSTVVTTATDNITMSAWVKWNGGTGNQFIINNGNSGWSGYGIMARSSANGNVVSIICGGISFLNSSVSLPTGQWTHVAAVRNNGTWSLYINGANVSVSSNTTTPLTPSGATTIGSSQDGGELFNGLVDQVKIYERALTQNQIAGMYNQLFSDNFNDNSLGGSWTTYNGTWSESSGVLSQTSTADGNPKKATISNAGLGTSTAYMITAKVRVNSWTDGDDARAGVSLFTNTSDGKGLQPVVP